MSLTFFSQMLRLSVMTDTDAPTTKRDAQRLETRQRIYDAALAEFKRSGMADADVGAIVAEAGVARGTFYFHFPTKEHVLEEAEGDLVQRLATDLGKFTATKPDLWSVLEEIGRLVVASETRLGTRLFRDVLALHFSTTRPPGYAKSTEHPLVASLSEQIRLAQKSGTAHPEADPDESALFFLLGVYSLLVTVHQPKAARGRILQGFVRSTRRGLEAP